LFVGPRWFCVERPRNHRQTGFIINKQALQHLLTLRNSRNNGYGNGGDRGGFGGGYGGGGGDRMSALGAGLQQQEWGML
jgi:hypothetical protein